LTLRPPATAVKRQAADSGVVGLDADRRSEAQEEFLEKAKLLISWSPVR
jgi:hypothetical protein